MPARLSGVTVANWYTPALALTDVCLASVSPAGLKNEEDASFARARNALASRLPISPAATLL